MVIYIFIMMFILAYLLLGNDTAKVIAIIIGSSLINIILLFMPSMHSDEIAIAGITHAKQADPIPQALVLTAIVISLAFIILYIKLKEKESQLERSK